jgi:hypothetical protein
MIERKIWLRVLLRLEIRWKFLTLSVRGRLKAAQSPQTFN